MKNKLLKDIEELTIRNNQVTKENLELLQFNKEIKEKNNTIEEDMTKKQTILNTIIENINKNELKCKELLYKVEDMESKHEKLKNSIVTLIKRQEELNLIVEDKQKRCDEFIIVENNLKNSINGLKCKEDEYQKKFIEKSFQIIKSNKHNFEQRIENLTEELIRVKQENEKVSKVNNELMTKLKDGLIKIVKKLADLKNDVNYMKNKCAFNKLKRDQEILKIKLISKFSEATKNIKRGTCSANKKVYSYRSTNSLINQPKSSNSLYLHLESVVNKNEVKLIKDNKLFEEAKAKKLANMKQNNSIYETKDNNPKLIYANEEAILTPCCKEYIPKAELIKRIKKEPILHFARGKL